MRNVSLNFAFYGSFKLTLFIPPVDFRVAVYHILNKMIFNFSKSFQQLKEKKNNLMMNIRKKISSINRNRIFLLFPGEIIELKFYSYDKFCLKGKVEDGTIFQSE